MSHESSHDERGEHPDHQPKTSLVRSLQRPSSVIALIVLLVVVAIGGYVIVNRGHAATRSGILYGDSFGGSSTPTIQAASAQWSNTTVGRYYYSGDPVTYSAGNLSAIPARETIFVSFKTNVATVKSGAYDATFTTILRSWNASGRTIYWTWQHEADDPAKSIAPADFVAGYNHLLAVAHANPSPNVHSMSIFMAYVLLPNHPHGNPESWYVNTDVLGFDSYNLNTELLAESYASSKGKQLAFPEIGDGINAGQTDAQALSFARSFVAALTPNVFAVVWYNQGVNKLAPWPNTLAYLKTLPSSTGTPPPPTSPPPTSPPPTSPPPTTPPPADHAPPSTPSGVTATVVGGTQVRLSWTASTDTGGSGMDHYVVKRDGTQLATPSGTSYADAAVATGNHSYVVSAVDGAGNTSTPSTTVTVTIGSSSSGLQATYYNGIDFSGSGVSRVDPNINFDWGTNSPVAGIGSDDFSARWVGQITAPSSETYTFTATSDDGVRLWINHQLVINAWYDQGVHPHSGTVRLTAGVAYDIELEYYEHSGVASAKLNWQSASTPNAIVPSSAFTPAVSHGLSGTYYSYSTLGAFLPVLERTDPTINFDWAKTAPAPGVPIDKFAASWIGKVVPTTTETYTFSTRSDDGLRLWINGQLLVDHWNDHSVKTDSGTIDLVAGQRYDIKVDYYENTGNAVAQLLWSSPTISTSPVPQSQLYTN